MYVICLTIENTPKPALIRLLLLGNLFGASKHRHDRNAQQMALARDEDQSKDSTQQVVQVFRTHESFSIPRFRRLVVPYVRIALLKLELPG